VPIEKMGCQDREAIVFSPRPLIVDFDIPALGEPLLRNPITGMAACCAVRNKRPRSRRATEKNNKVAPPHAFTSGRGSTTYHTSSMNGVLRATENPDA